MSVKPVAYAATYMGDVTPGEDGGLRIWKTQQEVELYNTTRNNISPEYAKHRGVAPLYSAPAPELAEALQALLNATDEPMKYHPGAFRYTVAKDAALKLLARITPK